VDPSFGSEQVADEIAVPLCGDCAGHLPRSNLLDTFAATGIGLGGAVVALGIAFLAIQPADGAALLRAGASLILVSLVPWALRRGRVAWLSRLGHHARFALTVDPGACRITTNNPRLRDELLAAHRDRIRLVGER
jgi:hypothetical protein